MLATIIERAAKLKSERAPRAARSSARVESREHAPSRTKAVRSVPAKAQKAARPTKKRKIS
jgi:hypothetical protein